MGKKDDEVGNKSRHKKERKSKEREQERKNKIDLLLTGHPERVRLKNFQ